MHGYHLHAGLLGATRQLRRIQAVMIPTQTHLQRHRNRDRLYRRLDQRQRMIKITHQRRTAQAAGHLPGRTAHIDVDDVRARLFGQPRADIHPVRFTPGKLDHMGTAIAIRAHTPDHILAPLGEGFTRHHLADHQPRAKAIGLLADRPVRHTGHGRKQNRALHANGADIKTGKKGLRECHSIQIPRLDLFIKSP